MCVAQKISRWYEVGIHLNIPANDLDMIIQTQDCPHLIPPAFKMLRSWRNKNLSPQITESELKGNLRRALRKVVPVQIDAIEELYSDANQVLHNADVRGDAVVEVFSESNLEPVEYADAILDIFL